VAATAVLVSVLAPLQRHIGLLNVGLLLLLLTLAISSYWGMRVGVFAAVVSNLALNFFFVEPLHRFYVRDPSNVLGLVVFLLVSVVGGALLSGARTALADASLREKETLALLKLNRTMIGQRSPGEALHAVCREVVETFAARGASVLAAPGAGWLVRASAGDDAAARDANAEERMLAQRAVSTGNIFTAGERWLRRPRRIRIVTSSRHRTAEAAAQRAITLVPLRLGEGSLGVLRIDGPVGDTAFRVKPDRMLEAFAAEAALALERVDLARAADQAHALRQADELKTALITSVSHDLKTPLAAIKAAVSSLLDASVAWSGEDRLAFLDTIESQTDWLNRTITNMLDLNRIESGAVVPLRHAISVADLLADTQQRAAASTRGRIIAARADPALVLVSDESLVAHALVNLLENAAKYSIPHGQIRMIGRAAADVIEISVEDEGPGIAEVDLPHIFERFYRGRDSAGRVRGSGLGLAIVKSFIGLCGGSVRAETSSAGTRFVVSLPSAP
jgi:two-component system sensor histidine kinase KdpD